MSRSSKPAEAKQEEEQPKTEKIEEVKELPDKKATKKTKMLDKDTVQKASELASTEASQKALKSIPKTAAGLEKDYNQLKKDQSQVYRYLRNIPPETVAKLYKTTEVEAELLSAIVAALANHGLSNKEDKTHAKAFLSSLEKASNFDMTLMFAEDKDKEMMDKIKNS